MSFRETGRTLTVPRPELVAQLHQLPLLLARSMFLGDVLPWGLSQRASTLLTSSHPAASPPEGPRPWPESSSKGRRVLQPTRCNCGEESTSPCSPFNAIAPRLPRPAMECAPAVPRGCAASGASLSQRADHVPVPLVRRNRSRLPRPAECAAGVPRVCAASGSSQSQRAEHFSVPLARRDPPPACHSRQRDVSRACH